MRTTVQSQVHVLNGDGLLHQFPAEIRGTRLVARECLVDGPVNGDDLQTFYHTRHQFLSEHYGAFPFQEYADKVIAEFDQLKALPAGVAIHLWFEEDLFCQVNFWFVAHLLSMQKNQPSVYYVGPKAGCEYSFAHMSNAELEKALENKINLSVTDLQHLSALWTSYQQEDMQAMLEQAIELKAKLPFLIPAIQAHQERIETTQSLGKPKEILVQLIKELETTEFRKIFPAFNQRAAIYGFGDLQVKRLFDELIEAGLVKL